MRRRVGCTIRGAEAGGDLLDFLAGRFTYHSRAAWQREIVQGRVLKNKQLAGAASTLERGDTIEYLFDFEPEPEVEREFAVLYEDDDLLAVDKPANIPCHPGGRYFKNTLWARVRETLHLDYLAPVNRLDRETSGIVLMAKKSFAARHLSRQFADGLTDKRYLVLVEGEFPEGPVTVAGFLVNDPASRVRKKRRFIDRLATGKRPTDGECCCTVFHRLAAAGGVSLLEAVLETGRCHQVRATLCSLGYPVVGDKIYGLDETLFIRFINDGLQTDDLQRMRLARQALHAAALRIVLPRTGAPLQLRAPLPPDMHRVIVEDLGMVDRWGWSATEGLQPGTRGTETL